MMMMMMMMMMKCFKVFQKIFKHFGSNLTVRAVAETWVQYVY